MSFTSEQILLIIAAVGVVVVNIINAWRTNAKTAEMSKKTDENTEVTIATKATVDRVETQTNGHLSTMTTNVQNLEAKLEMALKQNELTLKQNADLQSTNTDIVAMMKSLLEAEAKDKRDIVRAIELNGTSGGGRGD